MTAANNREQPMSRTVPTSTYRLHLTGDFTLDDAADLVDHIDALGVDWVYLSPIQTVPRGATHGYHVLDPDEINPELGGEEALARLRAAADEHDRGMLLDIVPNHLGASVENPWWRDVLTHGAASAFAHYFDVDFEAGRVVLPVLGGSVEEAIAEGAIRVTDDGVGLQVHETRYPLAPGTDVAAPLATVLEQQAYELTMWREGEARLNWRRFFAVNELAGVRVEDPEVFDAVHRTVLALLADGTIDGLRVDHIDGLSLPGEYVTRLRDAVGPDTWVVVEKIVELDGPGDGIETLPASWPVAGTTGYETGALIQSWLTDTEGHRQLVADFRADTGLTASTVEALPGSELTVTRELFTGEVARIVAELRAGLPDLATTEDELAEAVMELSAHLDGYRTYAPVDGPLSDADQRAIEHAAERAGTARAADLGQLLQAPAARPALLRWQQLTGPATAKGFEDRLMFQHVALASLCEVGADAHYMDSPPDAVTSAALLVEQATHAPYAGITTSTHDAKRSEDVRARLLVLAEAPAAFRDTLQTVTTHLAEGPTVDGHARWLILQAVIGTLGLAPAESLADTPTEPYRARLAAWTTKALREADLRTGHRDPDEVYEAAVLEWLDRLLSPGPALAAVQDLVGSIALAGATNSLATVVLKIAAAGVPDIYRGCEIWDDSLTDPDNRRPLQVDRLRQVMASLDGATPTELLARWEDGAVKMHVTRAGLHARRDLPEVFLGGTATTPEVAGARADHVCALARTGGEDATSVVAVTPRRPLTLAGGDWATGLVWDDTTVAMPAGTAGDSHATELLTGRRVPITEGRVGVADALTDLPVALLRV